MATEKMTGYKIVKPILGAIYKLWYNPKVIGAENIPTDGPIVVAGNHIHIMDQCNVIIATKRCLHYMAKKEYFDGKFAFFFKSVGCIPVDRSKKDETATASALEVLNNGLALGIFPEGTRNGLKDARVEELYNEYMKDKIWDIRMYMIENYKTITLKELANHFHYSESYLSKFIHRQLGLSFSQLLQEIRLEKSCQLLVQTDMKITELCENVGYNNESYYINIFHKKYGITPLQYRKKHKTPPF